MFKMPCQYCKKYSEAESVIYRFCSPECEKSQTIENERKAESKKKEAIEKKKIIKFRKSNKDKKKIERIFGSKRTLKKEIRRLRAELELLKKSKVKSDFYESDQWRMLRFKALKELGRRCCLCGTISGEMHVDHIKPRSKFPELELEFSNLQILCRSCNLGKGNRDTTDFRCNKNISLKTARYIEKGDINL